MDVAEQMTDCVEPPFLDGGITIPKFTKHPQYRNSLVQGMSVFVLRQCWCFIFIFIFFLSCSTSDIGVLG